MSDAHAVNRREDLSGGVTQGAGQVFGEQMAYELANATLDTLRPLGIQHLDMPLTPGKLWRAMQAARTR